MRSKAIPPAPIPANARGMSAEVRAAGRKAIRAGATPQRTVARSIVMGGQGLHTGLKTGVILHPAPAGFGIVFTSLADETAIPVSFDNVTDTGYNTTLTSGGRSVRTVEHLLSALHAFGITNLLIKTDDEVPALDGSALEFCKQLGEAGLTEQDAIVEPIKIKRTIADWRGRRGPRIHKGRSPPRI